MTSRERVLRNDSFQSVDRFTIGFYASSDVHARLREPCGALGPPSICARTFRPGIVAMYDEAWKADWLN